MREIRREVKFWTGDIVKDHFGRTFRVERLQATVDLVEGELTSYVCVRTSGCFREEEFLEHELSLVREGKSYES